MTNTTNAGASGYVVATALRGQGADVWELRYHCAADHKPSDKALSQCRQAWPAHKVRVFTEADWDALPDGARDYDWVTSGNRSLLRSHVPADGVQEAT